MISLCQQRELTAKWEAEHQCPAMACAVPPVRVNEYNRSLWPCKTVNAGSVCYQCTPLKNRCLLIQIPLQHLMPFTGMFGAADSCWHTKQTNLVRLRDKEMCVVSWRKTGAHGATLLVPEARKQIWNGGDGAEPYLTTKSPAPEVENEALSHKGTIMTTPNPHSDKDNWEEKALPLCLIIRLV